ncbi:prolipoprotein diacylglyceryl transferase [Candidatus Woesearchaeota archaeon]|nr:prolipoprotein diacylglyceryl transferase [Candidatus Woesearchaeota archaeon]
MIKHALNPTLLNLGPLEIRWYGLMYLLGFFVVRWYGKKRIETGKLKLTVKELDDLLGSLVLAMIVGARLGYALFYNPSYFAASPWKIFFVWEGGLSFHGGFLGVLAYSIWFARSKKLTFLHMADALIAPLALANAFGRIGNFINGELYGIATNLPWGVLFPGVTEPRHPTQIYEAAYNLLIFAVLYSCKDKNWKQGTLFGLFMVLYSIFRFSAEFIKDIPMYGPLTMGQWLSIPLFFAGLYLLLKDRFK